VGAVVANGLGGGSLINAGVMAKPGEEVFKRRAWPKQIRDESADDRDRRFAQVKEALGGPLRADRSRAAFPLRATSTTSSTTR